MLISEIEDKERKIDQILMLALLKTGIQLSELTEVPKEIIEKMKNGEYSVQDGKDRLLNKTKLINNIFKDDGFWNKIGSSADDITIASSAWDRLEGIEDNILKLINTLED